MTAVGLYMLAYKASHDSCGGYQLLVKPMHKKLLKGTQRMPRHKIPMKDVEDCDKFRGAVKQALIRKFPNGETHYESCRSTVT